MNMAIPLLAPHAHHVEALAGQSRSNCLANSIDDLLGAQVVLHREVARRLLSVLDRRDETMPIEAWISTQESYCEVVSVDHRVHIVGIADQDLAEEALGSRTSHIARKLEQSAEADTSHSWILNPTSCRIKATWPLDRSGWGRLAHWRKRWPPHLSPSRLSPHR